MDDAEREKYKSNQEEVDKVTDLTEKLGGILEGEEVLVIFGAFFLIQCNMLKQLILQCHTKIKE